MRRLRWGILGPGRIAPRIARALSDNPSGELHAPWTVHAVDVPSVDDYRSEVDNLQGAILDGMRPRVDLAFSRGTIATLVALDRSARASLVHA